MPTKDPEKRREQMRAWRARNPDKLREYSIRRAPKEREYRQAHLGQYAEYQQNSRQRNPKSHLVNDARSRAKRHNIPYNITIDDIDWVTHCPVFGIELFYGRGRGEGQRFNSATLDRRVNELGYVKGNVFVISHRANRMKQDASPNELAAIAAYAAKALPDA